MCVYVVVAYKDSCIHKEKFPSQTHAHYEMGTIMGRPSKEGREGLNVPKKFFHASHCIWERRVYCVEAITQSSDAAKLREIEHS